MNKSHIDAKSNTLGGFERQCEGQPSKWKELLRVMANFPVLLDREMKYGSTLIDEPELAEQQGS